MALRQEGFGALSWRVIWSTSSNHRICLLEDAEGLVLPMAATKIEPELASSVGFHLHVKEYLVTGLA